MGLSFVLAPLIGASPLQAFAAGAALCSTSLGTTFTLLSTSGLSSTRLGVVLSSAAMMDDVVGLIMVQVISNLGASSSLDPVTVIRPVFVSLAFAILIPLGCRFLILPITRVLAAKRESSPDSRLDKLLRHELVALSILTCTLVALVAGATYAGSSSLLGAYIAGAMISWWDAEAPHPRLKQEPGRNTQQSNSADGSEREVIEMTGGSNEQANAGETQEDQDREPEISQRHPSNPGYEVFEKYYQPALQRVLKPFFFVCVITLG